MSGIVSRAFNIQFADAKDKKFTGNFFQYMHSPQQKTKFTPFLVIMVDIWRKLISPFPLFFLYASSYSPWIRDFSCMLYNEQELRRLFVDAIQSIQGNCCLYHCRLVLNVRIEPNVQKPNVLT